MLWGVTGLMLGVLGCLMTMTRLSTHAMYKKIDGMPGAAGHVLSTSLGRNWQASEMPVGVNPKTQEAVYRAIGRGGVVIVGEGARGRLTRLVNDERSKVQRVASGVPVTVLYVGHGDDEVPIAKLAPTIKALPKKVDRATMAAVIKRVDSVSQSLASLPIPKGIDPTKVARSAPALTRLDAGGSGAGRGRSGRLVVQAALIGVPDHGGDDEDQQQRSARSGARGPPTPRRARTRRSPTRRCPGLPWIVGMKTIWIDREDREDRERVPAEEARDQVRGAVVDEERADAAAEPADRAARPRAGSPSALRGSSAALWVTASSVTRRV